MGLHAVEIFGRKQATDRTPEAVDQEGHQGPQNGALFELIDDRAWIRYNLHRSKWSVTVPHNAQAFHPFHQCRLWIGWREHGDIKAFAELL